ncbi:DNA polymerase IV [soil metagenome]
MLLHRGLHSPENARVVFLDMNSFFASVEQQDRPELRGKPVAVASHIHKNGTVLAASYEAKAFGIKTGTKLHDARVLCPGITFLETSPYRYKEVHNQFVKILHDICGPEVQVRSIDEAAIFLSPNWYGTTTAHRIAGEIKDRFRKELGECIRCSIGIAPNSLLAKLATNLKKPDGLTEITVENTPEILSKLKLTDLCGIAERMARQLELGGINTPLELYNTPAQQLRERFGIWGQYWWWRLHGVECDAGEGSALKTMSHEHVLSPWISKREALEAVQIKMADRILYRLQRNHLQAKHLFVWCKLVDAPSFYRERTLDAPTGNISMLAKAFRDLMSELPETFPHPVRKVVVGLNRLSDTEHGFQLDLFSRRQEGEAVGPMLELIRDRYGYQSIQTGSSYLVGRNVAKQQLGFGRLKDIQNLEK